MADEIRFYHLHKTSPKNALIKLLPPARTHYGNIVVTTASDKIKKLNRDLWVYADDSFLPHGAKGEDDFPDQQPIWINDDAENPNGAKILFALTPLPEQEKLTAFNLICLLFDAKNTANLQSARMAWKHYQEKNSEQNGLNAQNINLCYYRENEAGQWQKQEV